jgi:hypothetical protein
VVIEPAARTPFLTQIKLAYNFIFWSATIRFPSIIKVSTVIFVFNIIETLDGIVTLEPAVGINWFVQLDGLVHYVLFNKLD